jgi:hypothetical protein
MRNNVVVDVSTPGPTGGYVAAYRRSSTTLTSYSTSSNNNAFYVNTGAGVRRYFFSHGTTDVDNDSTFSAYKTRMATRDQSSFAELPPFINVASTPYDLHMQTGTATQTESGGTTVSSPSITLDFDGDTRNASTPDVGADEFAGTGLDLSAPSISYTPLGNTSSTANRVLSATISDASGVPTSGAGLPVLYWKINAGSYTAATATYISGNTYEFSFGEGVVATDVVSYYVVAQDNAGTPNIGASPSSGASGFTINPPAVSTPPTTPNSYTIIGTISGTKTVGASGADYATLTLAVADLNNKELVGALTFSLIDASYASETLPITINANGGSSATNTVTISPASGVTATISGSSASSVIKINGADYVTIDGSNSGGTDRSLTISNTSTSASTAAIWNASAGTGAGATNNTFKNCNISTGSISSITYGVFVGGASLGTSGADNDYVTVQNDSITAASVAIYAIGTASTSTGGLDNLTISGNMTSHIGSVSSPIGIQVGNALNSSVTQNTVSVATSASTQPVGISLETGFVSSSVTRNNIGGVSTSATGGYGGRGITIGTGTASSSLTIANNFISGVNGSNYTSFGFSSSMGIAIGTIGGSSTLTTTTGGVNLYDNSVNMYGSYSYAGACLTAALYVGSGASALDIRGNIFANSLNNTNASGTASKNYTVYSAVANTAYSTMNYNDYFKSGTQGVVGYLTSDRTDLAGMQTGFGQNVNSITADPYFTSSSDLHINTATTLSPVNNIGTTVGAVTVDYDGDTRSGTPDIGADEFSYPVPQAFSLTGPSGAGAQVAGNLSWVASTNASGYDVYFDQNNPPTTLVSSNQAETTWGYSGSSATTYYWNVVAKNVEGTAVTSSNGPLNFLTVTPPAAPTGLTLTNVTSTSMDVTWTDNATSDDSFYVYRKAGSAPSVGSPYTDRIAVLVGDTALTVNHTINETGLSTNVKYYYRVSAINAQGESNYTEGNATTLVEVPDAPTASNVLYTSMTVTLAALGNNPEGTELSVRVSGPAVKYLGVTGALVDTAVWATYASFGGASGKAITGLAMGTTYTFEVKARNLSSVETAYGSSLVQSTLAPVSAFPYTQNFDDAADPTWYSGSVSAGINDWQLGTPAKTQITGAHTAPNAWVTKLTGNYSNSANAAVYSPYFDFSALTKSPFIAFWHNFSEESGWDAEIVEYTTDFGASWRRVDSTLGTGGNFVTVNSANWYNSSSTSGPLAPPKFSGSSTAFTGHASGYIQSGSQLVGLEGKSAVQFRFRFASDGYGNSYDGWAFDDVTIARDILPPTIVYTPLVNTTDLANRNVVAKITDATTGVQRSANGSPRLWFKKNAGDYVSTAGIESPADTFTFTIDYSAVSGIVPGDQISYYVAAQDSADLTGTVPAGTSPTIDPPNAIVAAPNSYYVIANNDIQALTVDVPVSAVKVVANNTFAPKATFRNLGVDPQLKMAAFPVRYQIFDGSNILVYEDEQTVPSLASGTSLQVTFGLTGSLSGTTALAAGSYTSKAIALLAGDQIPGNDTVTSTFTVENPLSGTYTIGTAGNYATLTAFAADLNILGLGGNVEAVLTDYSSATEVFPITFAQAANYGGGPWTLTIKPAATQTATISGSSADAIIKLNGADYVTIDGSNSEGGTSRDLTISNTNAAASTAAIWVASSGNNAGATNVTIKNCNISSGYIAGVSFGIYVAGTTISSTGTGIHNHNLTIENNAISKAYNGIYVRASSGNATNGILIKQNVIGSSDTLQTIVNRGIDIRFANAPLVTENVVFGLYTRGSINNAGIDMGDEITNGVVSKNKVYGLRSLNTGDYGAYGIVLSAPSGNVCNVDVINNIVYDIVSGGDPSSTTYNPMGIRIFGGLNHKIYNNSVYMTGDLTTADMSMAFVVINSTVTGCDVRNNIFANAMTGTTGLKSYAIYTGTNVVFGTIDYNDYYATGPIAMFGRASGADVADLAAWKTYTGQDVHSISAEPGFTSATDLHINVNSPNVESRGTPLASVTSDFDGDARSESLPDLGADEYAGPAPATFSLLMPANNSYNQGISGTLTWNASAGGVLYDVYLDQNDPPTTLVSGNQSGTSYVYAGLTKGFNYFWKVVAKNNSGNEEATVTPFKFSTYTTPQSFALIYPANNAVAVPNHGLLKWSTSHDILKNAGVQYNVFLDTAYTYPMVLQQIGWGLTDTTLSYAGLSASTKYYWKVEALNDLGTFPEVVDSFTVESPVQAFNLLTPANTVIGVPLAGKLTWEASPNAVVYDVYNTTNAIIGAADLVSANQVDTVYNYSGLLPSTVYTWKVVAKNSVSALDAANAPFTFTTTTPPNAPTDLVISNVTEDSMDLSWTQNSGDETGFYIYRSLTGEEGSYTKIDSVPTDVTTYTGAASRSLGVDTKYFWRVDAYSNAGESNFASNVRTTLALVPGNTFVYNPGPTSFTLRISPNANPAHTLFAVRVQFNVMAKNGEGNQVASVTKYVQADGSLGDNAAWQTYANWGGLVGKPVTELSPSTAYTFDAQAKNLDEVETAFGNQAVGTTSPVAPSNLTFDNITNEGMQLNWVDNSPDEVGFYIYNTVDIEAGFILIDSVGAEAQQYISSGLSVNTEYFWRVSAYNANGISQYTSGSKATLANAPSEPIVSDSTFTTFKVTLVTNDGNPSLTEYAIRVGTDYVQLNGTLGATEAWATYAGWGGASGKKVIGLTIASTYSVDAKARNINGTETAFGTARIAQTAPRPSELLNENFATYTGAAPPPINWNEGNDKNILDGGSFGSPSSSSWTVDGFGNNGTTGAARFNYYSSEDWDWLVSPVIDMTLTGSTSTLSFDVAATTYSGTTANQFMTDDTLFVVVSTDSGVTFPRSNVVAMFHSGTTMSATGQSISADLTLYSGFTKVRIGFLAKDGPISADYNVYIDNVKIVKNFDNDIKSATIEEPLLGSIRVQNDLFPTKASFKNVGRQAQNNINVAFVILDSASGSEVLSSTRTIPSLDAGATQQVTFDDALISNAGTYRASAIVQHNDEFAGNDTFSVYFKIVTETRTNLVADNGGYIFSSSASTATPRPTYGWEDAGPNSGGTKITMADDDDAMSSTIYMPRAFSFYGAQYQALRVNTNGFITFDTTYATGAIYESQMPNSAAPNYIVAAFWDDLDSKAALGVAGSGIYYKSVNNKFYVEWYKCQQYGSSGNGDTMTFQIVLDMNDNSIALNYASPLDGNFLVGANDGAAGIEGDGTAGNGSSYYYTNNPGLNFPVSGSSVKFGTSQDQLYNTASISGMKFMDADGDGVKDVGENGIGGWTINADGPTPVSVTTDLTGYYEMVGLLPGTYTITENDSAGWVQTAPVGGSYTAEVAGSQAKANLNFGNYKLISEIHGAKWNDLNGNGLKENGEPGLENWEIHLNAANAKRNFNRISQPSLTKQMVADAEFSTGKTAKASRVSGLSKVNSNGILLDELIAYTDANGNYEFVDLPLGNYILAEQMQNGWLQMFPASPGFQEVIIDTFGRIREDVNFGNFKLGTISGKVYNDFNNNGAFDNGEAGVSEWTIVATKDGDFYNAATTDQDGNYSFADLVPGTYEVSAQGQNRWVQTEPANNGKYTVTMTSGLNATEKIFGMYQLPSSLSGKVYNDQNLNGTFDNGEAALSGYEVILSEGANALGRDTSDENGLYSFGGLYGGTYTVSQVLQLGWILTEPTDLSYTITVEGGQDIDTLNFGNRETTPGEFLGTVDSLWSTAGNWGYGVLPSADDTVYIGSGVRIVLDGLNGIDTIAYLTIDGTVRVSTNETLTILGSVNGTGAVAVDANAQPVFEVSGDWNPGSFTYGKSTVSIIGDDASTVDAGSFYKLVVSGANTSVDGTFNIYKSLTLNSLLNATDATLLKLLDAATDALQGTGYVSQGTIVRTIGASETGAYRFHSPNSTIAFNSGKSSANPPSLSVKKTNGVNIPANLHQTFKGGTINADLNTATLSGVTHFSRWILGQTGHPTGGVVSPTYEITEEALEKSASTFSATVTLEYDQDSLHGIPEQTGILGLFKTANAITVMNVYDADLSIATTDDRAPKDWGLRVSDGTSTISSANTDTLTIEDVGTGSFTAFASDSGSAWTRVGTILDGTVTAGTDTSVAVSFTGEEGTVKTVTFISGILDTYKFRTFKAETGLTTKATKMKFKSGVLVTGTEPNLSSVGENLFAHIGKAGATFLGIAQTDAAQAKLKGWIAYKKFADLAKLYTAAHDGQSYPIDSLRVTGKKSKKLNKAIAAAKKTYNNPIWEQGVMFNMNIIASANEVTPKGFGSLLFDTTFTLIGRELKGLTLNQVKTYLDSLMTEYTATGVDAVEDYNNLGAFANLLERINESFYTAFAVGGTNSAIDTAGVNVGTGQPGGKKNAYAVTMLGYRTASEAGGGRIKKNPSAKDEEFVLQPYGYVDVPVKFEIAQNYPNPFNPTTNIDVAIPEELDGALATMKVYNVLGQEVATILNNTEMSAGINNVTFDASKLSSGVYFYRISLNGGEFSSMKKMVLMK